MNKVVYALLDPRKPGKYEYQTICFLFEPFYIGKGVPSRPYSHFNESVTRSCSRKNTPKQNKIRAICEDKLLPIVSIICSGLHDYDACCLETELINDVKTKYDSGPLCNIRKTSWESGKPNTSKRTTNYQTGKKYKHCIIHNRRRKIEVDKIVDGVEIPKFIRNKTPEPSKQRIGETNGMFGKSAVKGRKWVTILDSNESRFMTLEEIAELDETSYRFGRTIPQNKRMRVCLAESFKTIYVSENFHEIEIGQKFQFGLTWKQDGKIFIKEKENVISENKN